MFAVQKTNLQVSSIDKYLRTQDNTGDIKLWYDFVSIFNTCNNIFPSSSPNLKITCFALESDCLLNCPLSQICSQFDSSYCCKDAPPSFVPIMLSVFVLILVFLFCCSNCKCEHQQNEPRNEIQMERDIIQTTEIETVVAVEV
ncbi:Hypothetical_protein [Hexamita inflata]|uniref:Hypothetical_protein n=1 Tax=Hexamita inflata TaxID=28002 RepID=A0AA86QBP0_9EUKA|nr:Hypothetical protein HINF_LOCUS37687 [Hexamita inflata]